MIWSLPEFEAIAVLGADKDVGLSDSEVKRRRKIYGENRIREQPVRSSWSILAEQFKSLIMLLLVTAAAISFLYEEIIEAWAIVVVIALNTLIGFFTELRAVRSMESLRDLGSVRTRVRREGRLTEVNSEDLVPGDMVFFEGGDVITVDARIIEGSAIQADESTLTGESLPVNKDPAPVEPDTLLADRSSMLYKGTFLNRGSALAVVSSTGHDTELGAISDLLSRTEDERTPLEERLDKLGYRLIIFTLLLTVAVTLAGILRGREVVIMIETGIALAVASIPEGLPIVATIALARGMKIMAKRNALITRLSSVETLGATDVIFTDKTGTLTENRMSVSGVVACLPQKDGNGTAIRYMSKEDDFEPVYSDLREFYHTAILCNNADLQEDGGGTGDPVEVALLQYADEAGLDVEQVRGEYDRTQEDAFDPEKKRMGVWVKRPEGGYQLLVKGAADVLLGLCSGYRCGEQDKPMKEQIRTEILQQNEELAAAGARILALAGKHSDQMEDGGYRGLIFYGLVCFTDPPRKEVRPAIARCKKAGIDIIMVTGDHARTAEYIAAQTGLLDSDDYSVMDGRDVDRWVKSGTEKESKLPDTQVFARISPAQKMYLIDRYQEKGKVVAMTGDGVNDAPALKSSDIGIAMGKRGTQVAREASDMVLLDDSFESIVMAIEQGRIIFKNIRRFIFYLLSCNVSEVMVIGIATLFGSTLPLLPLQILFLNLVTDVFPALALGAGAGDDRVMERGPRRKSENLLEFRHWRGILIYGLIISASVLGVFYLVHEYPEITNTGPVTLSFLCLSLAQLWHVFNMRSTGSTIFRNSITANPFVWVALTLCIFLILAVLYIEPFRVALQLQSPDLSGWILIIAFSLVPLAAGQLFLSLLGKKKADAEHRL